jgi:hypothetical protein
LLHITIRAPSKITGAAIAPRRGAKRFRRKAFSDDMFQVFFTLSTEEIYMDKMVIALLAGVLALGMSGSVIAVDTHRSQQPRTKFGQM